MAVVYILYSKKVDRFYIGSCLDIKERLLQHKLNRFAGFTNRSDDWALYFTIDDLEYKQSRSIETHIKKMKSKIYIKNLSKYPEMVEKLINQH